MTTALLFLLLAAPQRYVSEQTPARDLPFGAPVGTALISGKVVTDEADPKPLRKTTVMLRSDAARTGWTFVTDDTGAFAFRDLPAGRYSLSAMKVTYVTMSYGALKPGRSGQSIVLTDGQTQSNIVMKLPKGAVITGTVRDEAGVPVPNVQIEVMRFVVSGGVRSATFGGSGLYRTDDRGVYRVFGLMAGEYSVSASVGANLFDSAKLKRASAADIDAAIKSDADGTTAPAPNADDSDGLVKANVYYPGTTIEADAGAVSVAAGEERSGIDITLQFVPAVTIEGRLIGPDGKLPKTVTLTMMEVGTVAQRMRPRFAYPSLTDGTFSFGSVSPGQYMITARATAAPAVSERDRNGSLFARAVIMY